MKQPHRTDDIYYNFVAVSSTSLLHVHNNPETHHFHIKQLSIEEIARNATSILESMVLSKGTNITLNKQEFTGQ